MVINCFSLKVWCHWSVAIGVSVEGLKVEEEEKKKFSFDFLEHITIDDQNTCFEYLGKKASLDYGSWVDGEARIDQMW